MGIHDVQLAWQCVTMVMMYMYEPWCPGVYDTDKLLDWGPSNVSFLETIANEEQQFYTTVGAL